MERLLPYTLPAVVVLTSVGALVMCLIALRFAGPPDSGEELDDVAHRLFVLRFGHAVAAFCFAASAVLAVVGLSAQRQGLVAASAPGKSEQVEQLRADLRAVETDLRERLGALEQRLTTAAATARAETERRAEAERPAPAPSSTPNAPAPAPSSTVSASRSAPPAATTPPSQRGNESASAAATSPPPTTAAKPGATTVRAGPRGDVPVAVAPVPRDPRPTPPPELPSRTAPGGGREPNGGAALARSGTRTFSVHGTRVELASDPQRPAPGQSASYTVRLVDTGGRPVTGAEVSLLGRRADGTAVETPLASTDEPGTYRGQVAFTADGPGDLRLRVARASGRFEIPLGDRSVGW